MNAKLKIFDSAKLLSAALALEFRRQVVQAKEKNRPLNVALSGGSTPEKFFSALVEQEQREEFPWEMVHFFWGDERCVPPNHEESNFGIAKKLLLDKIKIPGKNIHRIKVEEIPEAEPLWYRAEIEKFLPQTKDGFARFDWIFLGMGEDGHTASIFPDSDVLKIRNDWTAVATHPITGQKRITLTLPVINRAKRITFLITGKKKAGLVGKILAGEPEVQSLPAAKVRAQNGLVEWYLDREAASSLG